MRLTRFLAFIREAWRLVRMRDTMTEDDYERAKEELVARYSGEQA